MPNNGAAPNLPPLESYLGTEEEASLDAERIKGYALTMANLRRIQEDEQLGDEDVIPGHNPDQRTFKEQRAFLQAAYERRWKIAEEGGYRALVEERLAAAKR